MLFLNSHHLNTNKKSKSWLKKALVSFISRNNAPHTVRLNSSMVINVKPKSPRPDIPKKQSVALKPALYEQPHWKQKMIVQDESTCPAIYLTHSYIRSTRSNPNQLKLIAAANASKTPVAFYKVLRKREDEFVWGKQSPLRSQL